VTCIVTQVVAGVFFLTGVGSSWWGLVCFAHWFGTGLNLPCALFLGLFVILLGWFGWLEFSIIFLFHWPRGHLREQSRIQKLWIQRQHVGLKNYSSDSGIRSWDSETSVSDLNCHPLANILNRILASTYLHTGTKLLHTATFSEQHIGGYSPLNFRAKMSPHLSIALMGIRTNTHPGQDIE